MVAVELSDHETHILRTLVKERLAYVFHELRMRELQKMTQPTDELEAEIQSFGNLILGYTGLLHKLGEPDR